MLTQLRTNTAPHILAVVDLVWNDRDNFIRWPTTSKLYFSGKDRTVDYHSYTPAEMKMIKEAGVSPDTRSNGPAVVAYLLAGGERPTRPGNNKGWNIHHIYDGKFPAPGKTATLHAVKDPAYFSHSGGLVAIHPVADALADEVAFFAWLLRNEAFSRFNFNPDGVF